MCSNKFVPLADMVDQDDNKDKEHKIACLELNKVASV